MEMQTRVIDFVDTYIIINEIIEKVWRCNDSENYEEFEASLKQIHEEAFEELDNYSYLI